jgi:hypothetical protein
MKHLTALIAFAALAVPTSAAAAEKPKKKPIAKPACEERELARVFAPWHDRRLYTLAPGGDFETQAEGWTLEGPAAVVADSSPFLLGEALGVGALELGAGGSAVSPPICVERGFPSFRFLARSADEGALKVQVLYDRGKPKTAGRLKPGAEWAPARKFSLAQGRFKAKRGASATVRLRFAVTAGTVRVDDVHVDPRYNR